MTIAHILLKGKPKGQVSKLKSDRTLYFFCGLSKKLIVR